MKERNFAVKTKDAWDWVSVQYNFSITLHHHLNLSSTCFSLSFVSFLVPLSNVIYHWYLQLWNTFFTSQKIGLHFKWIWKKTSFQTESSMGGSLGGRELDEQVEKISYLGRMSTIFFGLQVVSWASAHNCLLARLGQGGPDVKVLSVTKVDSETK